ncbi:MAG: cadherin-like beta sandwich domain-containing protein, partial [Paracholeplasma sp.]
MKRYLSFILIFLITVGISSSFNEKSIEASENIFEFSIKETKSQSSSILPEDFPSAYINANNIFTVDIYMTSVGTDRYIDSLQAKWSFDEAKLKFMGVMAFHLKNDPDWMGEQTDVFEKSLVSANYFILGLRMGSEKDKWLFQANQPTKVATIGFQTINFTTESVLSLGLDFLDINAEIGVAGVTSYDRTKVMTTPLSVASQGEDASLASLTVGGQPISVGSDGSNYNTSITYGDSLLSLETLIKALPTKASAVVTLEKSTTGNVKVNDVVTITVTDGSVSQTHTVTFIDVGSPVLELSQLNFLANGYGISPVFNSATTNYQIEIPGAQQATGFSINPVAVESYAITEVYLNNVLQSKVSGKYQFSNLTGGDHTVLVIVKAGGESKNYTFNVNQKVLDSTATIQDFGVVVSKYPTASGTESIDAFGTSTLLENQDKFSFKVNFIESTIKKVDFLVKVDGTQTLAGTLTKNTTIAGQWSYVTGISVPKGKTAEVILNATAENGDIASNTFFVQRAQSSYAELGQSDVLLSENGVDYTAVRSNNIYTYNVREDQTTSLLFKVLSTSNALKENASITLRDADTNALIPGGNISVSAQEGSKSYKIVVVSEDGLVTNEYTLNVVRLSNDLSFSIKVTKTGSLDELLNTASFTLSGSKWIAQTKLVYDVNGVDVFLEANHPNATISIKNNGGGTFASTNQNSLSGSLGYNLVAEQTRTFSVTITAENKVTMDYEISITREKANTINTLESFMIGGNQPGDFISNQIPPTTYQKLVLDPDLTAPTLYVNAEVTGGNTLGYTTVKYEYKRSSDTTYTTGQSITYVRGVIYDVKVTVTSQAGVSNTYLVQMVVADTNNQINDVLIEDASNNGIPFSFDKTKTTYTIEVNAPVASLKFNVTKDSDSASLTSGADANGFVTLLQAGQTTVVKLYLTSESGDKGTEYTFNIVRKAYRTNTDINSIEVIVSNEDGTSSFTPTYDSTRSAYYLRIDSTYYANVVVKATLPTISTGSYFNGNKQVFSETKTIAAGSEATYQIRVIAEDGQTYQDYPVIVKRANQTTTFDHVVLNGQTYTFSQFVAGTLDLRSIELPFSLSKMDLTIEESDTSRATVELTNPALIDGQWVFNSTGVVEFRFTMLAEDQTTKTTYKIQLTRLQASTDASLKEFQFNSSIGNLLEGVVPVESGNNVTYTIRADRGVTIDSIVATPNHPNATKNILYTSLDLVSGGEKQFSITVEAEDKTVKRNYHVVIIQKNDNHLVNDISFAGIDYDFTTHVNSVDLGSFLYSTKTFLVTVNREDTYAKVLVDGVLVSLDTNNQFVYNLKQGSQSLTIQTESEFGTKGAIYRYTYTQEVASSEAVLKSLSAKVDGVDLLSGMTLNNLIELSLDRSYNGKTITLLGVADKNGTITSGNTSKALSVGLNTFEVIVRSEDGTTSSTYTIKIYVYSSVSTLNTLSISELSSFTYDQGVTSYDLGLFNYSAHQGKLTLNLTYGDTYAKLYIDGVLTTQTSVSYNLKEGSHVITVRVVAEDTQTEVNYTLSYERLSAKTDNSLEGLEVMVGGVNQLDNFDPLTLSYELRVERSITSLEIIASVNPSALSKVSGAGTKVVNVGVDNTYLVIVTAEDGQTKTYQIKVVSKNDVNEINNIVISGISYDFSSHINTKDLGSFPYS